MKILAKIDDKRFMAECTGDELANVLGYSGGQELDVNEMLYQACQSVKDSATQIQEAIKTHKRLVANMEVFSEAVSQAAAIIVSKKPKK